MIPLLYIGLSQAFFAGFIVFTKRPRYLPDTLLGFWLSMIVAETGLSLYLEVVRFSNAVLNISLVLPLTYMPFMFLYVRTLISESPRLTKRDMLHFIPFLFFFFIVLLMQDRELFYARNRTWPPFTLLLRLLFAVYFLWSLGWYSIRVLQNIREHQRKIKDRFSYTSEMLTLNWLKFVLALFVLGFTGLFVLGMLVNSSDYPFDPRLFTRVALTIFAFGVSYFGIKQPTLYKPSAVEKESGAEEGEKSKYQRSGLTKELAKAYLEQLQTYMETARPWLDPELTIKDLADHLGISRHHITQVINENLHKNFFQWINNYRIEEVKKRLRDPRFQHLTIVALAYDCGFNSKSAFNSIFKKATGQTPSEFRRVQS